MFQNNKYAKIWKIYPKEKADQRYTDVQLSTSKKEKGKKEYTTDFSDNARLIGDAHTKAANLEANDRIKIIECGVSNFWSKEKNRKFYTFCIFDFEFDSKQKQEKQQAEENGNEFIDVSQIPEDELPFAD
jgi:hypothetical protein